MSEFHHNNDSIEVAAPTWWEIMDNPQPETAAMGQEAPEIPILATNPIESTENVKGHRSLRKISGSLGSNEGGWYEDTDTGERSYLKFYENPDQGRVEFIANTIYHKLGIKAAKSELLDLDGRPAVASREIAGAQRVSSIEQYASQDVRRGFVADAYLANWDVVGLVYDNIVRAEGGDYRIDNGGSMIFRAQGGDKTYTPDDVPELVTLLKPERPAGEVFQGITESEMAAQARDLVDKLQPEILNQIVGDAGLSEEAAKRVLDGLLGRREFLARRFNIADSPVEDRERYKRRVGEVVSTLSEIESIAEKPLLPRDEIICDHDQIEGQHIDIVGDRERGVWQLTFKLTPKAYEQAIEVLQKRAEAEKDSEEKSIGTGKIEWNVPGVNLEAHTFAEKDLRVAIAEPSNAQYNRVALGLVQVMAPYDMSSEQLQTGLQGVLDKLAVQDGLEQPTEESERQYKNNLFAWHYKKADLDIAERTAAEKLERQEVADGYSAMVQHGKYEELAAKYCEVRAVHHLSSSGADSIYGILSQGLAAATERYKRGFVTKTGMSPMRDLETGGADNVFVRTARPDQLASSNSVDYNNGSTIIFKPTVYDRMDWYAYNGDRYGRTNESDFAQRIGPDELFRRANDGSLQTYNEQMFRTGIGPDYVESIVVDHGAADIIAALKARGLETVDGRPIEEVIRVRDEVREEARKMAAEQKAAQDELDAEKKAKKQQEIKEALEKGDLSWAADLNDLTEGFGVENVAELFRKIGPFMQYEGVADKLKSLVVDSAVADQNSMVEAFVNGMVSEGNGADTLELLKWGQQNLGIDWAQILKEQQAKEQKEGGTNES